MSEVVPANSQTAGIELIFKQALGMGIGRSHEGDKTTSAWYLEQICTLL